MISLQKLFGKDDKVFSLLEASGEAACNSVRSLSRILVVPGDGDLVARFHATKEVDKKITEQIGKELVSTFVTQLEREDIEVSGQSHQMGQVRRCTALPRSSCGPPHESPPARSAQLSAGVCARRKMALRAPIKFMRRAA